MRIGIDLRVLASGRRTGIEEYTIGLLDHLLPMGAAHEWVLFYNALRKPPFRFGWDALPGVRLASARLPNRALMLSATYLERPRINTLLGDIDLFFAPHFFPVAVARPARLVVTFHDLSFVRYPEFFSVKKRLWHALSMPRRQAHRADHIITVSESSRRDLVALYGIAPPAISVVHSGIADEFRPMDPDDAMRVHIRRKYRLPERFILYFGTLEPRKNIVGLIRAFERIAPAHADVALVLAGSAGWLSGPIDAAARTSPFRARIHYTGFIPPEEKRYLYSLAECFVYPSFFEGFGFPPLEAMACGIPTITARGSSLPETVGNSALLVDPWRVDELAWAIGEVLSDASLRSQLGARGLARAAGFSWRRAAQSTMQIFESML